MVEIAGRIAGMLLNKWMGRATEVLTFRVFVPVLAALLFFGAMFWAKGRDPFQRIWFKAKAPGFGKAECIAVLPKTAARPLPVVVYLHGSGGSFLISGNELRQMAEMGLAAVGMDYDQANEPAFKAQFTALLNYLLRQSWADTNRIAWVGYSLGAQRELAFALRHPELQPRLLVRLAGGWVQEVESKVSSLPTYAEASPFAKATGDRTAGRKSKVGSPSLGTTPSTFNHQLSTPVSPSILKHPLSTLIIHGERDEVFPLAEAQRVAACLQSNGLPVELKIVPGEGHGFGANRLLLFRLIGEYCLEHLKGPEALGNYRSILSWQAGAKPLWVFWIPACLWGLVWWDFRHAGYVAQICNLLYRRIAFGRPPNVSTRVECSDVCATENGRIAGSDQSLLTSAATGRLPPEGGVPNAGCDQSLLTSAATSGTRWDVALRWVAGVLAAAAVAQTALHLVPPRLAIGERTLAIARKHLVQPKEMADFEFLAANPVWRGKPLSTLLEHVELANYNRELIDWKLDEQIYRDFVLSPQIDPEADGDLNWRRPLWENFYPRIRKEPTTEAAAVIVARFLRERVTIQKAEIVKAESRKDPHPGPLPVGEGEGSVSRLDISSIWQHQLTDARGFEAVYVAAMRSAGIPSRLDSQHLAELWTGSAWQPAPRPVVEAWN